MKQSDQHTTPAIWFSWIQNERQLAQKKLFYFFPVFLFSFFFLSFFLASFSRFYHSSIQPSLQNPWTFFFFIFSLFLVSWVYLPTNSSLHIRTSIPLAELEIFSANKYEHANNSCHFHKQRNYHAQLCLARKNSQLFVIWDLLAG